MEVSAGDLPVKAKPPLAQRLKNATTHLGNFVFGKSIPLEQRFANKEEKAPGFAYPNEIVKENGKITGAHTIGIYEQARGQQNVLKNAISQEEAREAILAWHKKELPKLLGFTSFEAMPENLQENFDALSRAILDNYQVSPEVDIAKENEAHMPIRAAYEDLQTARLGNMSGIRKAWQWMQFERKLDSTIGSRDAVVPVGKTTA